MERLYITKIEASLRSLKLGAKTLAEVQDITEKALDGLKKVNVMMFEDLNEKWALAVLKYNQKKVEKV